MDRNWYIHRFIILCDKLYIDFLCIKIDDVSCANLGFDPPQLNHVRFRSSGGGNDTSAAVAVMILRSLFRRVGLMGDTVAVMSMPYLLRVVGGGRRVRDCIPMHRHAVT